jgi:hypothetical protein
MNDIVISGIYKCKFVIMDVVIKLLGFWKFESIVAKHIKIIIKKVLNSTNHIMCVIFFENLDIIVCGDFC